MLSIGDRAEAEIAANLHGMVVLHLECSHAKVMPSQPIMFIGKSNRGSDVGRGAWLCCTCASEGLDLKPGRMTVPTNQIHYGYYNILSYPLEHDDKIYIFSG